MFSSLSLLTELLPPARFRQTRPETSARIKVNGSAAPQRHSLILPPGGDRARFFNERCSLCRRPSQGLTATSSWTKHFWVKHTHAPQTFLPLVLSTTSLTVHRRIWTWKNVTQIRHLGHVLSIKSTESLRVRSFLICIFIFSYTLCWGLLLQLNLQNEYFEKKLVLELKYRYCIVDHIELGPGTVSYREVSSII